MKAKNTIIALAFTAATALTGAAAYMKATSFPPALRAESEQPRGGAMRAPLNDHRTKGLKIFGATQMDYDIVRHFSNYYENEYMLEKLKWISKEDEEGINVIRNFHAINAGAYNPDEGVYYAYKVRLFSLNITQAYQWLKVDPRTGEWTVIKDLPYDMHDMDYLYDMAYSVYEGEMYGLVQNSDNTVRSRIAIMNLEDSSMKDYIQLDDYYFAIAFDYDGTMYGVRWILNGAEPVGTYLDEFDGDFKVKKSTRLKVNGADYASYYQHGLDFDYSTGDLLWGATDKNGNQRMIRINPDTYETTDLGSVGFNEVLLGLYVPFETAEARTAPARIEKLSVLKNRDGSNTVTLSWRNPATCWNRTPLNNLSQVYIYRDSRGGEPVGKVDAAGNEGNSARFVDNAPQGVHTYYVRAVNADGLGVLDSIQGFSGRDVPGKVSNLTAEVTDEGHSVKLTWGVPATGDSEGWYDSDMTYTVTRMPGNTVVARNITERTYEDKNIEEAQYYNYTVVATNADGDGTPCTSNGVLAGASLKIPFRTSFDTADEAARFSSIDAVGPNNAFEHVLTADKSQAMRYIYNNTNDATLVSPPLRVEKGKKYRVKWHYQLNRNGHSFYDYYNDFRIIGGYGINYASMSTVIADYKEQLTEKKEDEFTIDGYFEAPEDGEYYVGFRVLTKSQNEGAWLYMKDFSIVESPDNDLEAEALKAPAYVSADQENYFDVTVYNNGSNPQSDYRVEVGISELNGTFSPFASTSDVPAIAAHESAVVRVKGFKGTLGIQDVQARVVLEGDGYAGNDFSELNEVEFRNGSAFNYHIESDETEWSSTSHPVFLYASNSLSQTIYPSSLFTFDTEKPEIAGLAWEYSSQLDISDLGLKIYLGQTGNDGYPETGARALDGQTLVFDGTLALEEGEHWLMADFADKAFEVDPSKNLVVTVLCTETEANGQFPALFRVLNSPSANQKLCDGKYHSVRYNGEAPFTFGSNTVYSDREYAKLHIALKGKASAAGSAVAENLSLSVSGNTLRVAGQAADVEVYDLSGRLLCSLSVSANGSVVLPVAAGAYVVKVTGADGASVTEKLMVR